MRNREEYESIEEKFLAPYAMKSRATKGRKYKEEKRPYRTCYQRDRDRIIHSTAFRRLEYKTQVFVNHEGDHYRTRLTHTIEVSQIATTIARALKLNEDLTESIALAHDIGHTPFGHAGEEALAELMEDKGGFEHNHQGLKVVDFIEDSYPDFRGLNLTYETREGIVKHRTLYDVPNIDNLVEFEPHLSPTFEAQVINVADEIAYNSHDLDDGIKSGYITVKQLENIPLFNDIYHSVKKDNISEEKAIARTIRRLVALQTTDVLTETEKNISEFNIKSLDDVRSHNLIVNFSQQMLEKQKVLKNFLYKNLYSHYKVLKMQLKARKYVIDLFRRYLEDPRQLPPDYLTRIEEYTPEEVVCDYIAGMTDRFAQDEYERLFIPYAKM
ncbi:deoxyguanosinetriphosphate triphosphohydrolase [candidate division WOR-3 bacterium]|nr:deoxyguanosinetriphosphate triphosphohydrolase [candidate division WOR-3 bacterium]